MGNFQGPKKEVVGEPDEGEGHTGGTPTVFVSVS